MSMRGIEKQALTQARALLFIGAVERLGSPAIGAGPGDDCMGIGGLVNQGVLRQLWVAQSAEGFVSQAQAGH